MVILPQVIISGVLFVIAAISGTLYFTPDLSHYKTTASCFLLDIPYLALALDNIQTLLGKDLGATQHLRLTCLAYGLNDPKDEVLISVAGILGNSNINHPHCPIDSAPIYTSIPVCDINANSTLSVEPLSDLPLVQFSLVETSTPTNVFAPVVTVASVPSALVRSVNETKTEIHDYTFSGLASLLSDNRCLRVGHCTRAEIDRVIADAFLKFLCGFLVVYGVMFVVLYSETLEGQRKLAAANAALAKLRVSTIHQIIVCLRNPDIKIVSPFSPVIDGANKLSPV